MILVVGVAGSGKSTQSRLLAEAEGWCWLSMGQILRNNLVGEHADIMNTGQLLDDTKVESLLKVELQKVMPDCKVVLDGFPRRVAQTAWLMDTVEELGDEITAVVHLLAHEPVVLDRLLQRGRQDDKPDAIKERFNEYEHAIKPLLDRLHSQGIPIVAVNGEQSPEEVHKQVVAKLRELGMNI